MACGFAKIIHSTFISIKKRRTSLCLITRPSGQKARSLWYHFSSEVWKWFPSLPAGSEQLYLFISCLPPPHHLRKISTASSLMWLGAYYLLRGVGWDERVWMSISSVGETQILKAVISDICFFFIWKHDRNFSRISLETLRAPSLCFNR